MSALAEDGLDRIRRLGDCDPLICAWRESVSPALTRWELDILDLVAESDRAKKSVAISVPDGRCRLILLSAVLLAFKPALERGSSREGPVALVTSDMVTRSELAELSVGGITVSDALSTVALRGDGLVRPLGHCGTSGELGWRHRLLLVAPRVGFPTFGGALRPRTVVIESPATGDVDDRATIWAAAQGIETVIAFQVLAAERMSPVGGHWMADWPYLVGYGMRPQSLAGGAGALVVADKRLKILGEARALLGEIDRAHPQMVWPKTLMGASALGRQLAGLAVPMDLYDAHTAATIAVPFAIRRTELEEARGRDLAPPFDDVADSQWGRLRHCLLEAAELIEEENLKAAALGQFVEDSVREGRPVDVLCESGVSAAATGTWLLNSGWGINSTAFADTVRIRRLSVRQPWGSGWPGVLGGIPAARNLSRLVAADVGPLSVLAYPFELRRLQRVAENLVNGDCARAARERRELVVSLSRVDTDKAAAEPLPVELSERQMEVFEREREWSEAGFLGDRADINLGSWWPAGDEDITLGRTGSVASEPVDAVALLVEPGPVVVLLDPARIIDRLAGGRLWPVPARSLMVNMVIVGLVAGENRSLFERLRPYLDALRTPSEQAWLTIWRSALACALSEAGGSSLLADRLRSAGAGISPEAVRGWSHPYRIGPRRPENVARIGALCHRPIVETHAGEIAAVMASVRRMHLKVGRHLGKALRAELSGNRQGVEQLDEQLGSDLVDALGDLSLWRVRQLLGDGKAPAGLLRRPLQPGDAAAAFQPNMYREEGTDGPDN
jgi:hypothetical protein